MTNQRIGFIGLGMMGHGMAKNLLAKGFPLTFIVHRDRSRLADLVAAGAREVKTPAEVARNSDVVIVCPVSKIGRSRTACTKIRSVNGIRK